MPDFLTKVKVHVKREVDRVRARIFHCVHDDADARDDAQGFECALYLLCRILCRRAVDASGGKTRERSDVQCTFCGCLTIE